MVDIPFVCRCSKCHSRSLLAKQNPNVRIHTDFVASTITAFMSFGAPMASAGPVRGTHEMTHHAGRDQHQPLSGRRRALLGFQVFVWNVACVGSIVVAVVFWGALVRKRHDYSAYSTLPTRRIQKKKEMSDSMLRENVKHVYTGGGRRGKGVNCCQRNRPTRWP